MRNPAQGGASDALAGDSRNPTPKLDQPQLARLPRTIFRKLAVRPTAEGWVVEVVGYDPKFWDGATSRAFSSRFMALEAAKAESRRTGLPLVAIETLTPPDGPIAA